VPEGLLIWLLLQAGAIPGIAGAVPAPAFCLQFLAVWIVVWLVLRADAVPFIRWRSGRTADMSDQAHQHQTGLWSSPGPGVLSREGDLILLAGLADTRRLDELLALLAAVAEAGGRRPPARRRTGRRPGR